MGCVFRIRIASIHQQGFDIDITKNISSLPNFLLRCQTYAFNKFIELKAGACPELLKITEEFHDALLKEYEAYRLRALATEAALQCPRCITNKVRSRLPRSEPFVGRARFGGTARAPTANIFFVPTDTASVDWARSVFQALQLSTMCRCSKVLQRLSSAAVRFWSAAIPARMAGPYC